jgi:biopolymer transport protein ExbD
VFLFVDGAPELEFADVATVIDIVRGAGVNRVGLLTSKLAETAVP